MKTKLLQVLFFVVLVWWCVMRTGGAAEVAEPTVVVKETLDEVLRLVTDEDLKKSE